ncbi:hypothetical protein MIPYR_10195 [uncultured Microbacterium sp.]|uniref:Uncharacterized protein n=1 Tax=uncultured Microbacterium sp. TaxID=191216 RepID=A0A1Y5NUF1_9MICO|nr:hypothetical protein MIPYR_10195 [uncultured Microbacterium sp.]
MTGTKMSSIFQSMGVSSLSVSPLRDDTPRLRQRGGARLRLNTATVFLTRDGKRLPMSPLAEG